MQGPVGSCIGSPLPFGPASIMSGSMQLGRPQARPEAASWRLSCRPRFHQLFTLCQLSWRWGASPPQTPWPPCQSGGAAGSCPGQPAGKGRKGGRTWGPARGLAASSGWERERDPAARSYVPSLSNRSCSQPEAGTCTHTCRLCPPCRLCRPSSARPAGKRGNWALPCCPAACPQSAARRLRQPGGSCPPGPPAARLQARPREIRSPRQAAGWCMRGQLQHRQLQATADGRCDDVNQWHQASRSRPLPAGVDMLDSLPSPPRRRQGRRLRANGITGGRQAAPQAGRQAKWSGATRWRTIAGFVWSREGTK